MGVEQRVLALVDALLRDGDERVDVCIQLLLLAVVGVQGDVHRIVLGHDAGVLRQGNGTGDHVLDLLARGVLGTTSGDLDDAVRASLGEPLQGRIESLR